MNIFSKFYDWIADDDSDNDEKVGWKDVDWGKSRKWLKDNISFNDNIDTGAGDPSATNTNPSAPFGPFSND